MRKIIIKRLKEERSCELVSSKRNIQERVLLIKGTFDDNPEHISRVTLSPKENKLFERGEFARVKGGIFSVKSSEQ